MPGPTTEVLNDDVKELKGDIRDIRGNLDVLKADVHRMGLDVAGLKAEFGVFKWLLGLCLVATLSSVGVSVWWADTINSEVRHLAGRLEKFEGKVDALNGQVNEFEEKVDAGFDRLESAITKAVGRAATGGRPATQ